MLRRVMMVLSALGLLAGASAQQAQAQLFGPGQWSGLYVGVHGGYNWDKISGANTNGTGLGLQAGYNLQLGQALVGIEADYTWSQAKGDNVLSGAAFATSIDNMWSVRGRLGYVFGSSVLLYGTAGYGGYDTAIKGTLGPFTNFIGNARSNSFVVGGGAELMITRSLLLRAEALVYTGADSSTSSDVSVIRLGASYKF